MSKLLDLLNLKFGFFEHFNIELGRSKSDLDMVTTNFNQKFKELFMVITFKMSHIINRKQKFVLEFIKLCLEYFYIVLDFVSFFIERHLKLVIVIFVLEVLFHDLYGIVKCGNV